MTDESFDETPWGEDQCERFMQESDARSARYGELLETLMDHPDRDAIIRREMGWDKGGDAVPDGEDDWNAETLEAMNEPPDEEAIEEVRRDQYELDNLPAYSRSFAWSMRVFDALGEKSGELGDDFEELLGETICDSQIVAAKIARGHGMGYEDEVLCGNIVCCKRALEAAKRSLKGLLELNSRQPLLNSTIASLLEEGQKVERLVEVHIAGLRARVWWE